MGWAGRSASPSRARPAAARTTAAAPVSRHLRRRVSTLPRSARTSRSGRARRSSARRRSEPVRTTAPRGRSSTRAASSETRTSRASTRSGKAATTRPGASATGRSLRLWTARSTVPSSSPCSSSSVKSPLPPAAARSPGVTSPAVTIAHQLDREAGVAGLQRARHQARLGEGERALPGAEPEGADGRSGSPPSDGPGLPEPRTSGGAAGARGTRRPRRAGRARARGRAARCRASPPLPRRRLDGWWRIFRTIERVRRSSSAWVSAGKSARAWAISCRRTFSACVCSRATSGSASRPRNQARKRASSWSTISSTRGTSSFLRLRFRWMRLLERVDGVEEEVAELARLGIDVARHAQVDDQERTAGARRHRLGELAAGEDRLSAEVAATTRSAVARAGSRSSKGRGSESGNSSRKRSRRSSLRLATRIRGRRARRAPGRRAATSRRRRAGGPAGRRGG